MDAKTKFQEQLKYLAGLEQKARRLLINNENKKAVYIIKEIIEGYRILGVNEKANLLETQLKLILKEYGLKLEGFEEVISIPRSSERNRGKIREFIEALEKKVKRRILQGKIPEAIADLKYIISELRKINLTEKADLLETTLNQFVLDLSSDYPVESPAPISLPVQPVPPPIQPSPQKPTFPALQKPPRSLDQPAPVPPSPVASPSPAQHEPIIRLKDQPLSEEEVLVKKLLDVKDLLHNR